jgi:hypothetical protein
VGNSGPPTQPIFSAWAVSPSSADRDLVSTEGWFEEGHCLAVNAIWDLNEYQCWGGERLCRVIRQPHLPKNRFRGSVTGREAIERWLRHLPRWYSLAKALHLTVQSYNGGFIALSYIISVIGSLTTLELLRRVTSARGFLNW